MFVDGSVKVRVTCSLTMVYFTHTVCDSTCPTKLVAYAPLKCTYNDIFIIAIFAPRTFVARRHTSVIVI